MNHSGPSMRYRWPDRGHPEPHSCEREVSRKAATYLVLFAFIPLAYMGALTERYVLDVPSPIDSKEDS